MIVLLSSTKLQAQDDAAELAKKLSNPIASLISVPFQNNSDYGIGTLNGSRNTLNFQPVLPVSINDNLNMIARVVLPIVTQNNITGVGQKESGLSDAVVSAFFSPKNTKNGYTWGVGPAFLIPTGTDDFLTTKKFGIGPTAIALKQTNGWTLGVLANQIWSVAGSSDRPDVSQMFVQPFITHNWKSGAGLGVVAEYTQNWVANTSSVWLVPNVSGVTSIGTQKVSLAIGPRINIIAPESMRADWGWRAVVIFLFPK
ncbi:hypothetical protein GON26_13320 [Flavobacterium sp. GA093]|uniref:Transporter n=1 Tax=Flavobacterium hydrocarbonoxydans TaxID=2683249 RepID=A0A6I4NMM8_9FLAO|nr:hypothetical protein [Flavobacterium hydrocarbonoxydans]MWB95343.1 hypothetical protein [Flavobacterium hydrocarbonoxydans]